MKTGWICTRGKISILFKIGSHFQRMQLLIKTMTLNSGLIADPSLPSVLHTHRSTAVVLCASCTCAVFSWPHSDTYTSTTRQWASASSVSLHCVHQMTNAHQMPISREWGIFLLCPRDWDKDSHSHFGVMWRLSTAQILGRRIFNFWATKHLRDLGKHNQSPLNLLLLLGFIEKIQACGEACSPTGNRERGRTCFFVIALSGSQLTSISLWIFIYKKFKH